MSAYEDYDKTSLSYDESGRTPVCVEQILEKIADNSSVLDAGCGTGNYMTPLVKSGKLSKYTGFDVNEGMLEKTKAKVNSLKEAEDCTTEIEVQVASLLEPLPFENETFDVILHNEVMHHVTTPESTDKYVNVRPYLAEFYRILKPGGFITINLIAHAQQAGVWFTGGIPSVMKNVKLRFPDSCDVEDLLKEAGFKEFSTHIDHATLLGDNYFAYEKCFTREYRQAASVWKLADEDELDKFLEDMKIILDDEEKRKMFDESVRRDLAELGQSTQIFARK